MFLNKELSYILKQFTVVEDKLSKVEFELKQYK